MKKLTASPNIRAIEDRIDAEKRATSARMEKLLAELENVKTLESKGKALKKITDWADGPIGSWLVQIGVGSSHISYYSVGVFSGHILDVIKQFAIAQEHDDAECPQFIRIKKVEETPRAVPIAIQLDDLFEYSGEFRAVPESVSLAVQEWLASERTDSHYKLVYRPYNETEVFENDRKAVTLVKY